MDFRLVAATNRDLKKMIAAGTFREDLYYRINPMTLNLPPLSERVEDIPLIVRDVLNRMGGEGVRCTESAMNALMRYPWPGNIRELRNVLIRALSLCQDNQITLTDLPSELRQQAVAESAGTDRETPVRRQEQRSANHHPRPRRSPLERRQDGPRPGHLPGQHV